MKDVRSYGMEGSSNGALGFAWHISSHGTAIVSSLWDCGDLRLCLPRKYRRTASVSNTSLPVFSDVSLHLVLQPYQRLPLSASEWTVRQHVSQLFCGAHLSKRNDAVQTDSLQWTNPGHHGGFVTRLKLRLRLSMNIRMSVSLSLKMRTWLGLSSLECCLKRGQPYQLTINGMRQWMTLATRARKRFPGVGMRTSFLQHSPTIAIVVCLPFSNLRPATLFLIRHCSETLLSVSCTSRKMGRMFVVQIHTSLDVDFGMLQVSCERCVLKQSKCAITTCVAM